MARPVFAESESRGVYTPDPPTAAYLHFPDGDVLGLWTLPSTASVNEIRGAVSPKQPGLVVLLRRTRGWDAWNAPAPSRLEPHHILSFELVDDLEVVLLDVHRRLGYIESHYRSLLDGDEIIELAFLANPSQADQARVCRAMNHWLGPDRQWLEDAARDPHDLAFADH